MIRTRRIPFIQSWATAPVIALTSAIMVIGIALPFTPFADAFKMVPLPLIYFPFLLAILVAYCALTQVIKMWYIKKFDVWL
jgi:Mg2+-importing ATPase